MTPTAATVTVRPELHHLLEPLDTISPWPGNARTGDHDRIRESLTEHGQYLPLLVHASSGQVIKGNNTLAVMRELGWTHAAVLRLNLDDERARAVALIDNWTSDGAGYDDAALAALLSEVEQWTGVGWTPDNLDDLMARLPTAPDIANVAASALNAPPTVLPTPPATDARYAETPEAEAARQERLSTQKPQYTKGLSELILLLPDDDKTEALRLIEGAREWLGRDVTAGQIVLRALRTLTAVGDSRHDPPTVALTLGALLTAAGHRPPEEATQT